MSPRLSQRARRSRRSARQWPHDHPCDRDPGLRKAYGRLSRSSRSTSASSPGEVFGFLGPNGAGKTTRQAAARPHPPDGRRGPGPRRAARRPRRARAHRLPARAVPLPGVAHGPRGARAPREPRRPRPRRAAPPRSSGCSALVGLADRAATGPRVLEGHAAAARPRPALLGDPALVILDEPTSALDPVGRDDVRAIIRDAQARGARRPPQLAPAGRGGAAVRPRRDRAPGPGRRGRPADRPAGRDRGAAAGHRPARRRRPVRCVRPGRA